MKFKSETMTVGSLPASLKDTAIVKNEPMFFSASLTFAEELGGPITRAFIDALPLAFKENPTCYLDSRVHMLMTGWYPCIPGWHHDDVPRDTPSGQPNYINPAYRTEHIMALVNAEVAPTEFLIGDIHVPEPDYTLKAAIYKQWDEYIERGLAWNSLQGIRQAQLVSCPDRVLIQFNCDTFHRGTPAVSNGWRWFGRVSIGRDRKAASEIRRQAQVYMPTINAGW